MPPAGTRLPLPVFSVVEQQPTRRGRAGDEAGARCKRDGRFRLPRGRGARQRCLVRAVGLRLLKKRLAIGVTIAVLGISTFALAAGGPRYESVAVRAWSLTDVGRGSRSLFISYAQGSSSCTSPATARVIETRDVIRVRLSQQVVASGPGVFCTGDLVFGTIEVHLRHPVDGRQIVQPTDGAPLVVLGPTRCDRRQDCVSIVPRVNGLSPRDARRVLLNDGFRPRFERTRDVRGRPRVIGQAPAPQTPRHERTVTLIVSEPTDY